MKSFKRSLVFLMVFAMVLSTVAPVFAATPTDVVGTDYETAVGNLFTLGIVSGDETGAFNPDKNITRAEFSKIACNVLGMQSAADLSKGTTKFKDVSAGHWASGFINLASEKGLIKGYPDKTFKPEANVNYAEAITILVRALGMGDYVEKQGGTWPANYLEKASAAGITDGVSGFSGNGSAIRGMIAELAWNTLGAEKWGAKEYTSTGITYGPLGKSLLEEQYKNYVYKDSNDKYVSKTFTDVKVVGTQITASATVGADQIEIATNDGLKKLLDLASGTASVVVDVKVTGVDLNALYGKKVDLFFGKDNDVVNIKVVSKDVVEGTVDEFKTADKKIKLTDGKTYSFKASTSKVYVNTDAFTRDTFFSTAVPAIKNSTAKVSIVLDNGAIDSMNVTVSDVITLPNVTTMKQLVVDEITSAGKVKGLYSNVGASQQSFDLETATSDSDKCVIVKNGKTVTKDDIKVGDAVTYINNSSSSLYYIIVTDNKVTGTLTSASSAETATNEVATVPVGIRKDLTVGGKVYAMANDGTVLMTKKASTDESDVKNADDMKDFYNKDITLTLNAAGEIIFVSATTTTTSSGSFEVGVVSRNLAQSGSDYTLKLLTSTGVAQTFTVSGDEFRVIKTNNVTDITNSANYDKVTFDAEYDAADTGSTGYKELKTGKVVAYEVSGDGKIKGENLYVVNGVNAVTGASYNITSIADDYNELYVKYVAAAGASITDASQKINYSSTNYYAKSSTAYLNNAVGNIEKIDGWKNIVSDDYTANAAVGNDTVLDDHAFYIVADEDNMLKSVVVAITLDTEYLASDYSFGAYVGDSSDNENDYVTLNINGKETKYTVASSIYSALAKGDLVRFKTNSDGDILIASGDAPQRVDNSLINDWIDNESNVSEEVYKVERYDTTNRIISYKTAATKYGEGNATVASTKTVILATDAVVYDARDNASIKVLTVADITSGMYVVVDDYSLSDDNFSVAIIVAD